MLLKFYLAAQMNLFGDEAFYWLESENLALAYSDVPWLSPLLVKLGTSLFGQNTFGVRFFFILLGNSLPFTLYLLCKPIFNQRIALFSAALVACLPLLASLGVAATPDTPLISLQLILTLCLYRALDRNQWRYWLSAGVVAALCFGAHYRFFIFIAIFGLYLLHQSLISSKFNTRIWRNPKFYLALVIALLGFIPCVIYNAQQEWAAYQFHFSQRHPWAFNIKGLMFPFIQMAVASPLLFFAMLISSAYAIQQRKKLSPGEFLLLFMGLGYWLFFALLSPFSDSRSTTIHWPIFSYLLLLPLTVKASIHLLRHLLDSRQQHKVTYLSYASIRLTIALGCASSIAIMIYGALITQVEHLPYQLSKKLSYKMAGWEDLAGDIKALDQQPNIVITNNYYTAAQLKFYQVAPHIYTLDDSKLIRDGRATQMHIFNMDRQGLMQDQPQGDVLYIQQQGKRSHNFGELWSANACNTLADIKLIKRSTSFQQRKQFDLYIATIKPRPIKACTARCYSDIIALKPVHQLSQSDDLNQRSTQQLLL